MNYREQCINEAASAFAYILETRGYAYFFMELKKFIGKFPSTDEIDYATEFLYSKIPLTAAEATELYQV